jgi:hypothetical protein
MKHLLRPALLASVICLAGCSKAPTPPPAADLSQAPTTFNNTFNHADDQTRQLAAGVAQSFAGQDSAMAFNQMCVLSTQTNLTSEQRALLAKTMQTTFVKLQESAAKGDPNAQQTVRRYLSTR